MVARVITYRGEIHEKTVGMTLYRLLQDKLVRREGHTWFLVPQPIAETKNPGGETPGQIGDDAQPEPEVAGRPPIRAIVLERLDFAGEDGTKAADIRKLRHYPMLTAL